LPLQPTEPTRNSASRTTRSVDIHSSAFISIGW
jgi:hypothetical protein